MSVDGALELRQAAQLRRSGVGPIAPRVLGAADALDALDRDLLEHGLGIVELEIDGYDLVEAGVAEGPAIGRGLNAALAASDESPVAAFENVDADVANEVVDGIERFAGCYGQSLGCANANHEGAG